jgi:hypothetical protein
MCRYWCFHRFPKIITQALTFTYETNNLQDDHLFLQETKILTGKFVFFRFKLYL